MATPKLTLDALTARKWVRAYVAAGVAEPRDQLAASKRVHRLTEELAHWFSDELELGDCECSACAFWREEIRAHRRARS